LVREEFRPLLETQPDIKVIDEREKEGAVNQAKELNPDITLMNIEIPDLDSIRATNEICDSCPSSKVIILSVYCTTQHIFRTLKAGWLGYILKESAGEDLRISIPRSNTHDEVEKFPTARWPDSLPIQTYPKHHG